MDEECLNKKFIKELVEAYRLQPAIWKMKCPDYKNKSKKIEAYDMLVKLCRNYLPEADHDFVKNKINSLRTCFRKQYKKVVASQATATKPEDVFKPNLWYYDLLLFTVEQDDSLRKENDNASYNLEELSCDDNDSFDIKEEIVIAHSPTYDIHFTDDPFPYKEQDSENEGAHVNSSQDLKSNVFIEATSTYDAVKARAKKNKTTRQISNESTDFSENNSTENIEDIYDIIGRNVARKLRDMEQQQRIFAEKILSDVMYHGQMENLTCGSCLFIEK